MQLDISGGPSDTSNGGQLIQWPYWGGTNEIFSVNQTPDGWFNVQVLSSGKVLDVEAVSLANGAYIHQWDSWNGDNQKWKFVVVQ